MKIRTFTPALLLAVFCAACQSATRPPVTPTGTDLPATASAAAPSLVPVTPGPTMTPLPALREFEEGFDFFPVYWQIFETNGSGSQVQVENGSLIFDLQQLHTWVYAVYTGQEYKDVRIEVHVENRASNDNAAGLLCRYDEKAGWYEFNVYPDQTFTLLLGQWLAPGTARYTPLVQSSSEKIKTDVNELGLLCQGDVVTPFVNGVQLRKWQIRGVKLTGGRVGISASSFDHLPVIAAVDWVRVDEP